MDKRLWASEPVWWDRQHPSARSCWLRAFQVAQDVAGWKSKLPRLAVPQTVDGYSLSISQSQPVQPAARRFRERTAPVIQLKASSAGHKGYDMVALGVTQLQAQSSKEQHPSAALPCKCRNWHAVHASHCLHLSTLSLRKEVIAIHSKGLVCK